MTDSDERKRIYFFFGGYTFIVLMIWMFSIVISFISLFDKSQ